MPRSFKAPSYRHHKPSGQAVVTVRTPNGDRHDVYLGLHNSPESLAEYSRVIAELATTASGEQVLRKKTTITVDQVMITFWRFAEGHYRRADGTPTNELTEYHEAFKPLRKLYGHTDAEEFGPLALKAVRNEMLARNWARTTINNRVRRIRHVFRWAAAEELVSVTVFQSLAAVEGLRRGRTTAREPAPVLPVRVDHVHATAPYLGHEVWAMIWLQLLTGMRPGEVVLLRPVDVDRSDSVWVFRPPQHKTTHRERARVIPLGPRAQEILRRFEPTDPQTYYFSPTRAVERRRQERSAARKTSRFASHMRRNAEKRVEKPQRAPADRYTAHSYANAIRRAVVALNCAYTEASVDVTEHVPHWKPNQLRHTRATEVRKRYGLEAAQVSLGHANADVTQLYAERDFALAGRIAGEMG